MCVCVGGGYAFIRVCAVGFFVCVKFVYPFVCVCARARVCVCLFARTRVLPYVFVGACHGHFFLESRRQ